jgi:hypothetical protein
MELFLSHATSDKILVDQVTKRLEGAGVRTYLAEHDGRAGDNVHQKIAAAIQRCDVMIALLTHAGDRSRYVQQEIGFAKRAGKLIIPVVTAEVARQGLGMLEGTEYIVVDDEPSEALLKLSTRVARLAEAKDRQGQLNAALLVVALGLLILTLLDE